MNGIFTDFLNKSLPMPTEGPSNVSQAAQLLSGLRDAEIGRVIFAPRFSPRYVTGDGSIRAFLRVRNNIFRTIKPHIPSGIRYSLAADILMYPGCFNDPLTERLTLPGSRYVMVSLPFPNFYDEIWKDINKLVYHTGLRPVFTEFNRYLLTYSDTEIKKLLKVPGAAFQFNVRSLDYKDTVKFVISVVSEGKQVVFGTGARCVGKYEAEMKPHFKLLKRALGETDFNLLMLSANNFCRPRNVPR